MTSEQQLQTLYIAEIPFDSGEVQFRYSRYLSEDGKRWIRHGLFVSYYLDGSVASEGEFLHDKEHGLWSTYHDNGKLAARGRYVNGAEVGTWNFWDASGNLEPSEFYPSETEAE